MTTPARILVGTASWTDHEEFYPAEYGKSSMRAQRIAYYARYFSLVEVDSTFYRLQPARNFALWAERTPPDFVFDVKAYGEMTWHHRDDEGAPIPPAAETFARFSEMIRPLRDAGKLGAVLFQFPPWFTFDEERLDYLATVRELLPDDTLATEFRHRSWLEGAHVAETRAALTDLDIAYCAVDEPQIGSGSVPPVTMVTNPRFAMVRFHGRNRRMWYGRNLESSRDRFDYLYTQAELEPWAARIADMAEQVPGGQVHAVMNNNARNYSVLNALDLQQLLGQPVGKGAPLSPELAAEWETHRAGATREQQAELLLPAKHEPPLTEPAP
ncbi:MAG TPA: DUF72 domain-containing protein [Dehalococcoidia bacterium]|nr:DUF72 domain-containing protein [Dehalococcoidia bacterium]